MVEAERRHLAVRSDTRTILGEESREVSSDCRSKPARRQVFKTSLASGALEARRVTFHSSLHVLGQTEPRTARRRSRVFLTGGRLLSRDLRGLLQSAVKVRTVALAVLDDSSKHALRTPVVKRLFSVRRKLDMPVTVIFSVVKFFNIVVAIVRGVTGANDARAFRQREVQELMVVADLHHSALDRRSRTVDFVKEQAERLAILREPVRRNPGRFFVDHAFIILDVDDLHQANQVTDVRQLRALKFAAAHVPSVRISAELADHFGLTRAVTAADHRGMFRAHVKQNFFGMSDIWHNQYLL